MKNPPSDACENQPVLATGSHSKSHWLIPKWWVVTFLVFGTLPWLLQAWMFWPQLRSRDSLALSLPDVAPHRQPSHGPWGNLKYEPLVISPPQENLVDLLDFKSPTRWQFENMGPLELGRLLNETDLKADQVRELMAGLQPEPEINGSSLSPTPAQIEALTPAARRAIYQYLARSPRNVSIDTANCFPRVAEQAWLAGANLPQPLLERVRRMFYTSQRFVWFADLPMLLADLPDESTRTLLTQTLTRQYTYIVKLRIEKDQDVSPLVRYWGRGGRETKIAPLLESLANSPDTREINIQELLPQFARTRLYTYPDPSLDPNAVGYDCHWTGFNFFNTQPDPKPTNPDEFFKTLQNEYYPIFGDLRFGDLLVYETPSSKGPDFDYLHSAVFIAADMLFTKNSSRPTRPWMLMRTDDMREYYAHGRPVSVRYFRRKDLR